MDDESGNLEWAAQSAGPVPGTPAVSPEALLATAPAALEATGEARFPTIYESAKRVLDIVGALSIGLCFSPIILLVLLSLLRDGGSVIFSHTRVGRSGRAFKVLKFRTMVPNSDEILRNVILNDPAMREEWLRERKLRNDPRVTKIGRFLRRTSLDELPQLLNVLRGEMSLVGPRPVVREELSMYRRASRYYLAVKPGLTGLWQISGRNDCEYCRRVAMDRQYVQRASLQLDLLILVKTVFVVLGRRGAY
jgi:undecaprenyl-phosphate galactose phosphotransferase